MIVADSSYIVEGILADMSKLRAEQILAPSIAVYETVSAIWKHQVFLNRIKEGERFVAALSDLIRTNDIITLDPDEETRAASFDLAVRHRMHPHDAVFIAVALRNGLELETLDSGQRRVFEAVRSREAGS